MEMLTSTLTKIGPYLIAIPAAIFGILHFMGADMMAGMVPIPGGAVWVYITGAALIALAISVILRKKTRLAATLLGVMLLIFVLAIHLPGTIAGGDGGQMSMMSMLKDLMIAGGAFTYAGTQPVE
jgi:putative oxidoreductase